MTPIPSWAEHLLGGYTLTHLDDGRCEARRPGFWIRGRDWLEVAAQADVGVALHSVIASARHRVAVTGSHGKGSTIAFVRAALEAAGRTVAAASGDVSRAWPTSRPWSPAGSHVDDAPDVMLFEAHGKHLPTDIPLTVSVITGIGLDHLQSLGPSLYDITQAKARVSQDGVPLVVGAMPSDLRGIITRAARGPVMGAFDDVTYVHSDDLFSVTTPTATYEVGRLGLRGAHQVFNAVTAVRVCELLDVPPSAVCEGLRAAHLPGRCETLTRDDGSTLVLDLGKAREGCHAFARYLLHTYGRVPVYLALRRPSHLRAMVAALAPAARSIALLTCPHWPTVKPAGWVPDDLRVARAAAGQVPVSMADSIGTHSVAGLVSIGPMGC